MLFAVIVIVYCKTLLICCDGMARAIMHVDHNTIIILGVNIISIWTCCMHVSKLHLRFIFKIMWLYIFVIVCWRHVRCSLYTCSSPESINSWPVKQLGVVSMNVFQWGKWGQAKVLTNFVVVATLFPRHSTPCNTTWPRFDLHSQPCWWCHYSIRPRGSLWGWLHPLMCSFLSSWKYRPTIAGSICDLWNQFSMA